MKLLTKLSISITNALQNVFEFYGLAVHKRPYLPILFSLVLLSTIAYGNLMYKEVKDEAELWIPRNAQIKEDQSTLEEVYNRSARAQTFYVLSRSVDLISSSAFLELIDFQTRLSSEISVNDKFYNDLCLKSSSATNGLCETQNYPLMFLLNSDGSFDLSPLASKQSLLSRINSGKGTIDYYPPGSILSIPIDDMFGGTTPSEVKTNPDGTNNIQEAVALTWTLYLNEENDFQELEDFQEKIEALVEDFNASSQHIEIHPYSSSLIMRENNEAVQKDMQLLYLVICLELMYCFYVLGQLNTRNSRLFVGVFGLISVGFAYVETFGFGAYLGIEGNPLVGAIPFLLLGIGLDDMYVLLLALSCTSEQTEGSERMKATMKNAGVSITITSLTNVCAFAIGSLTSIPAVRNFCIYASFGMMFDYINQITLFLGVLAYDIKRSEKGKGDFCGLLFCKPDSKACCHGRFIFDKEGNPKPALSTTIIKAFSKFLMKTKTRLAVLFLFALLIAFNCYGLYKIEHKFTDENLIRDEFRVAESVEVRDKYFQSYTEVLNFYTVYADFESQNTQVDLSVFELSIKTCEGCGSEWIVEGSTTSWFSSFKDWASRGNCLETSSNLIDSDLFYSCVKEWEEEEEGQIYSSKLAWNESHDRLIGGAIETSVYYPDSAREHVELMKDVRKIGDGGPQSSFPLGSFMYLAERYAVFETETIIGLGASMGIVFVILILTLADFTGSLLALVMVSLSVVGQLGTLYYWGEYINTISITYSIMAIGVSVDYSSHFIHSFNHAGGETRVDKVLKAFEEIGVGIFNGGMSTLIGISSLILARAYGVVVFFKCWVLIIIYSLVCALILLPIILSFIGSVNRTKVDIITDENRSMVSSKPNDKDTDRDKI